jgi:hypothetical protein
MILPIISAGSAALRALENLTGSQQTSSATSSFGASGAGQALPTVGSPPPSQSSSRFSPSVLGSLIALQESLAARGHHVRHPTASAAVSPAGSLANSSTSSVAAAALSLGVAAIQSGLLG